jgi:hypothetical protein
MKTAVLVFGKLGNDLEADAASSKLWTIAVAKERCIHVDR